jgi:hypothetical protein
MNLKEKKKSSKLHSLILRTISHSNSAHLILECYGDTVGRYNYNYLNTDTGKENIS